MREVEFMIRRNRLKYAVEEPAKIEELLRACKDSLMDALFASINPTLYNFRMLPYIGTIYDKDVKTITEECYKVVYETIENPDILDGVDMSVEIYTKYIDLNLQPDNSIFTDIVINRVRVEILLNGESLALYSKYFRRDNEFKATTDYSATKNEIFEFIVEAVKLATVYRK